MKNQNPSAALRKLLFAAPFSAMLFASAGAAEQTWVIQEPFGLAWGPDRVTYPVEFKQGEVKPAGVSLQDAAGKPVPVQLSETELWPDGTVKKANASFMVTLRPDEKLTVKMTGGTSEVKQPDGGVQAKLDGKTIELTNSKTGIRLAGGNETFKEPMPGEKLPAPIQAVRLPDGKWIGKGWWQTDIACTGYKAEITDNGPVFSRAKIRYDFEGGKFYAATVELNAEQELATVSEEFNLSEGKEYEMPEQPGEKGRKYRFVIPAFDPPERGMLWDWWGGTGGRVPSPNAYFFSFHDGLEPTHCEWNGRMFHVFPEANQHGGGAWRPLPLDQDGRVVSVNAFLNWGPDESFYYGAYNPAKGFELAVIGLRPSQWINPDLEPKPIATLKQWTQTNNLWIERRAKPDIFLRAPACLGRRVYGIAVIKGDFKPDAPPPSDLAKMQIRHGRQRLDEVKDWILDYEEKAAYPRLLGSPEKMDEMRGRAAKWLAGDPHPVSRFLTSADPEAGRKTVGEAVSELGNMCRKIATEGYDHNGYAMNLPRLAWLADVALAAPECTPEEAAKIRRYAAACAYNALSPDYVPMRESGYCWGSANMMEALRLRGATPMVCLLPGHPNGSAWRSFLAHFIKFNAKEKINSAGATLEIGAYGVMAVEFATVPAIMLAGADPSLDFSDLLPLWKAAARCRLSYLTPPDIRGGIRPAAPIGDSPISSEGAFPFLVGALAGKDPDLAGQLMWGIHENNAALGGHGTPLGLLVPENLQLKVPDLRSEHFQGSGFILRNGFPDPEETYVNLNCGSFAIGHGHSDRHGFIMYAKGAPLMLDFASQYQPSMAQSWLHNGLVTFDHREELRPCPGRDKDGCYFKGKVWLDHKIEPFTCLEFGWPPDAKNLDEAFGKAEAFSSKPEADYAEMSRCSRYFDSIPYMLEETHGQFLGRGENEPVWLEKPITWKRQAMLVKKMDAGGADYLVVRDTIEGGSNLAPALNYWCLAGDLKVDGQRATWKGQHGVDLEAYVADPAVFKHITHRVGHSNPGPGPFGKVYQEKFGKPFREEQILLRIQREPGGGFFTVLYPRKDGEPAPKFETLADGNAIKVSLPQRTDIIVMRQNPIEIEVEGVKLKSKSALITVKDGKPATLEF